MPRKANKGTFTETLGALSEVVGVIIGLIGKGYFWGLGFWWAFSQLIK